MKILFNVERDMLADAEMWVECEGFKIQEMADGSFDLLITTNLEVARAADRRAAELTERIDAIAKARKDRDA